MSLPLLKPLLLTVGATSLVFFGGVIALTIQSVDADNTQVTNTAISQDSELTSSSSFEPVTHSLTQSARTSAPVALTAEQATALAKQLVPDAVLQATPELVNYNNTVAYEVILDNGVTYIDANLGTVLNPISSYQSSSFGSSYHNYDMGYDDDDDKHHDDDKHNRDKHHSKKHDDKHDDEVDYDD